MLRTENSVKRGSWLLDKIYNTSGKSENLDELNDVEVMEMAKTLRVGSHLQPCI